MRLIYIANERVPSEKANSINIVKMCSAFASLGIETTLVVPTRKNLIKEDVFTYYNIPENFKVSFIKVPQTVHLGKYGFLFTQLIFSLKIFFNRKWNPNDDVIFTRDIFTSIFVAWRKFKVFHDLHGFPEKSHWFWKYVLLKMDGIVCTNQWKLDQCRLLYGIAPNKMILGRNGFDASLFGCNSPLDNDSLKRIRVELGIPVGKPIVLYSGHFYDWKGVHILAEAAKYMPEVSVILVGGSETEIESFTAKYEICKNILILGHKPHKEVPRYLSIADILVLPNSLQSSNSRLITYSYSDTSPIKMFEYMAIGKPIVASDLPSIREVLDSESALFFEVDNPQDLADKIQYALAHPSEMQVKSQVALKKVQEFTWEERAKKILNFIQEKLKKLS